jgi:hypothetical protein
MFAPRVDQSEGEQVMIVLSMDWVFREILQGVVHPSHIPLEIKAEPAVRDRAAYERPGG